MKTVKPEAHYLGKVPTDYEGALKFIEMAGRTCYRSEDKIAPGSAEKFVRKLIAAGHLAMVEHSNFVVRAEAHDKFDFGHLVTSVGKYLNVYTSSELDEIPYPVVHVGGSLTAWWERVNTLGTKSALMQPFLRVYKTLFTPEMGW